MSLWSPGESLCCGRLALNAPGRLVSSTVSSLSTFPAERLGGPKTAAVMTVHFRLRKDLARQLMQMKSLLESAL